MSVAVFTRRRHPLARLRPLRRLGLRALAVILFAAAFIHDVAAVVVQGEEPKLLQLIRALLVPGGWIALAASVWPQVASAFGWGGVRAPGEEITGGRPVVAQLPQRLWRTALVLLAFIGFAAAFWGGQLIERPTGTLPASLGAVVAVHLWGLATVVLALGLIRAAAALVLFKRQRTTKRNLDGLLLAIAAAAASTFGLAPGEPMAWGSLTIFALAGGLMLLSAMRLGWVVYQPRRDKVRTLWLGWLVATLLVGLAGLLFDTEAGTALELYSYPLASLVRLALVFGAGYAATSGIAVLLHLPTARAFERKSEEVASLHRLSRLLADVLDEAELARSVVGIAAESGRAAWLDLRSADGWRTAATRGITPETIAALSGPEQPLWRELGGSGGAGSGGAGAAAPVVVSDVSSHPLLGLRLRRLPSSPTPDDLGARTASLLGVPLVSRDRLVGALMVACDTPFGFEHDDVAVLRAFADQAAIALENARLFAETLIKERLESELQMARAVQQNLLPQRVPTLAGLDVAAISHPAQEVGGDYYDFAELPGGRLGIAVADVSGKGTSAAFYMAELKGIFQCLSPGALSPRELLIGTNRALARSIDRRSFISMGYVVIDPATGEVWSARAGHCPLLIGGSGTRTAYLDQKGLGLGLDPGGKIFSRGLQETQIHLQPGDSLVLYSDGVVEAMTASGDEYGYDRLAATVAAASETSEGGPNRADAIRAAILDDLAVFTEKNAVHLRSPEGAPTGLNDDLTLVIVTWLGPPTDACEPADTLNLALTAMPS